MAVTLTAAAAKHVNRVLQNRGSGIGLRVGVKASGCSGMSYVLEFADHIDEHDKVFVTDDVIVVVDEKSLVYVDGTELDYTREGLNEGFKFNNPNIQGECGCGESFTV